MVLHIYEIQKYMYFTFIKCGEVIKIDGNSSNGAMQNVNDLKKRTGELTEKWWSYEGKRIKTSRC